ncbi:flagellar basal body rod protein FlgB [Undibacterium sp. LX40W]|uniref:Flagellar basal body rod protein FlgB n=1 Tax=Undibacterium nitidum TaxID=2762298 RepID=A0A923HPM1_9BURK|nr:MULTISPECIES: flagellar basal body rod protein FlgB [Undibacterium]MBC3880147.1 flagellar basal body rod protein FlgB [Undibacterium nitidum]MBC3891117.1 flagellar basal body rod protein FlgB [Undibacterium sp. LX40W]
MTKLDDYLRFHESALSVRGQRQQLLASNIANADTPNYKARDIDFGKAMSAALEKATPPNSLKKSDSSHLEAKGTVAGVVPGYRQESQGNVDGNTVNMDEERNAFTDNALRYEASLTMINMQIKGILAAIQG